MTNQTLYFVIYSNGFNGPSFLIHCQLLNLSFVVGVDSLLASEWIKLEELSSLLEPFATQTDVLQTDSQSLSSIIPSLLYLESHLLQHPAAKSITSAMLIDFRRRFATLLQPDGEYFNPIPAAACVLDPTVAPILLAPEYAALLFAAKMYIVSVSEKINNNGDGGAIPHPQPDDVACSSTPNQQSSFSRAKFLNSKIQAARESSSTLTGHQDTILSQLNHYLTDVCEEHVDDGLAFWARKLPRYNKLSDLGEDLMAAPASQAYVERIFSLCGQLTVGRRNRMSKSLEMRAFLKLNAGLCHL